MDHQPTCGQGLAANATLPATIGQLMEAMAGVLDEHQRALDLTDERTRPEHQAYLTLIGELRSISGQLAAMAQRMAGCRDLPMGRHDEEKMMAPEAMAAFQRFVEAERAALSLLTDTVGEHEAMLRQMQ